MGGRGKEFRCQGECLRDWREAWERASAQDFGTTMDLYAQSDMESMRHAQGKFLEQLMGDKIHLLTGRVQ